MIEILEPKDNAVERRLPFSRAEFVNVEFGAADTDVVVPYTALQPDDVEDVRWIDITPNSVYVSPTDSVARVYRSSQPGRKAFGAGYIVLRCNVANYATRLMLFVERRS